MAKLTLFDKVTSRVMPHGDLPIEAQNQLEASRIPERLQQSLPTDVALPPDLQEFISCDLETSWFMEHRKGIRGERGPKFVRTCNFNSLTAMDVAIEFGTETRRLGIGLNLIIAATDYSPYGLLLYLPEISSYGSFDDDHNVLTIFPNTEWRDIEGNIGAYVMAQWYRPNKKSFWRSIETPFAWKQLCT